MAKSIWDMEVTGGTHEALAGLGINTSIPVGASFTIQLETATGEKIAIVCRDDKTWDIAEKMENL